jgi:Flp pilus assembly protein TadG
MRRKLKMSGSLSARLGNSIMKNVSPRRGRSGISLVEFAAALALGLPLLIAILYVTLEASYYFTIRTNIDIAARNAARALAIEYGKDPTIAAAPAGPKCQAVLTKIRIPGFVANNAQFSTPTFDTTVAPNTVTIACTYPSGGAYGLPKFPNPDPLNLGPTFQVISSATFATE